jgi:meso-butanediol dehydrogenase/(S,S)-butanediol dehydrogenase/diacetyl reductase
MGRLAGKVAIITGGGGGIGAATARLFCAEGARVVLADTNMTALDDTTSDIRRDVKSACIEALLCDVSVRPQVEELVYRAVKAFAAVDVVVNNAAIRTVGPLEQVDSEAWVKLTAVNVAGAANLCQAAAVELRKSGRGCVVNVSSCYALRGRAAFGVYDATKAALVSFTRTLAHEEARYGIRVNAVCPGGTLTPFTIRRNTARGIDEVQLRNSPKPDTLLNRWAEAKEVAYPILWLASDEASFVTGATLAVDGGCSIM